MLYLVAGLSIGLTTVCLFTLRIGFRYLHAAEASHAAERAQWGIERANLCQRLQAPAEAVMQHAMTQPFEPQPRVVPMDDDNAFWESQMTKEQLAAAASELEIAEAGN